MKDALLSWACQCEVTQSNQEEADIKLILHAFVATANGTDQRRRRISLMAIFQSLRAAKAAALPAFNALSGADNTGSFSGKGKLAC